ncbi:MAG TPA: four helix bundle protein [Gammaproteobacteria bacterium]|nr:four helix bundle protein [Gammaproteobacteria bacterium]
MARDEPTKHKSYQLALKLVRIAKALQQEQREFVLSRQVLRSGTSIGANVEEATAAQSKKDFVAKMAIASKEARETHYWLRLLRDSDYLDRKQANELIRLLTAIVKTAQSNN